jgi:hypothetical protein
LTFQTGHGMDPGTCSNFSPWFVFHAS